MKFILITLSEMPDALGNCPPSIPFDPEELVLWLIFQITNSSSCFHHLFSAAPNPCSLIICQCSHLLNQLKDFKLLCILIIKNYFTDSVINLNLCLSND